MISRTDTGDLYKDAGEGSLALNVSRPGSPAEKTIITGP
jgi:hypothetical protein